MTRSAKELVRDAIAEAEIAVLENKKATTADPIYVYVVLREWRSQAIKEGRTMLTIGVLESAMIQMLNAELDTFA